MRSFVIAGLICSNLLVFALSGYSLHESRQQYELRAQTLSQNMASAVAQEVSSSVHNIDLTLRVLADELERQLAGNGIDEAQTLAVLTRHEQRLPQVEAFRVSNASGLFIIGKGLSKLLPVNFADRDYFVNCRDHSGATVQVSKPLLSRVLNRYVIVLARRFNHPDGSFAGVVHAAVVQEYFSKMLARFSILPRDALVLRDADLGLIARYPPMANRAGGVVGDNKVSQELQQLADSGVSESTYYAKVNTDDVKRTITFRRLGSAPMMVLVGLASDDYLADWYSEISVTLGLASAFLLLSLLLGWYLLRLISQANSRERLLSRRNEAHQSVLSTTLDGYLSLDVQGRVLDTNPRYSQLSGYSREELLGKHIGGLGTLETRVESAEHIRLIIARGSDQFESVHRRKDGSLWNAEVSTTYSNVDGGQFFVFLRDITARKAAEAEIERLAFYDPLTALPNRRFLIDRVQDAMLDSLRDQHISALLLVDLDNFKTINDTLGYQKSDQLLQQVAQTILGSLRQGDTVARSGGDEFVVLLEHLGQSREEGATRAQAIGTKVLAALNQTYRLGSDNYHSSASIGITLLGEQQEAVVEPFKRAELAMYQAKATGRNTLRLFEPKMQLAVSTRAAMEFGLRDAVQKNQLLLYYQAQVTGHGQITGVEVLLRWQDPRLGMVLPAEFIPLAETSGLILQIGSWVLETACKQLTLWASQPAMAHLSIAVNVSARQFHQDDFVDQVLATLARTGAKAQHLKLELTESLLVSNIEEVILKMTALRAKGVGFSLDDFGTGYSSLSHLKRLPLDQLKIDRGFVSDILADANDAAIAKMVLVLAESLGLEVIAEGVETEAQRDFLASLGCHNYQGYLFSKPLPIHEFEAFVTSV